MEWHETGNLHKGCAKVAELVAKNPFQVALAKQKQQQRENAKKLFRCVVHCTKRFRAFMEYEHLVYLLHLNGCEIPASLHSR